MERLQEIQAMFDHLKKDAPKEAAAFMNFAQTVKSGGAIDGKNKSLIGVALAISSQCTWCIATHVKTAVDAGASKAEIVDAAMMAVMMGGGPKLMYLTVLYEELANHFPEA